MIALETTGDDDLARRFIAEKGLSFVLLRQEPTRHNVSQSLYGVTFCPQTFLIDRNGRILHYHPSYSPGDDARIEKQVLELLLNQS